MWGPGDRLLVSVCHCMVCGHCSEGGVRSVECSGLPKIMRSESIGVVVVVSPA